MGGAEQFGCSKLRMANLSSFRWAHYLVIIMQVSPDEKPYDPDIPLWLSSYCVAHFLLLVYWYNELGVVKNDLPYLTLMAVSVYLVFSMITFGMLYDRR